MSHISTVDEFLIKFYINVLKTLYGENVFQKFILRQQMQKTIFYAISCQNFSFMNLVTLLYVRYSVKHSITLFLYMK